MKQSPAHGRLLSVDTPSCLLESPGFASAAVGKTEPSPQRGGTWAVGPRGRGASKGTRSPPAGASGATQLTLLPIGAEG